MYTRKNQPASQIKISRRQCQFKQQSNAPKGNFNAPKAKANASKADSNAFKAKSKSAKAKSNSPNTVILLKVC